jgi:hypothetical protein
LATSDCEYFVPLLKHFWPDNNWCQARVALVLRTNPALLRTYDSVATVALAVLMAYYTLTLEQQAALKDQCPGGTFTENIPHELHLDAIWHLLHPRVLIIPPPTTTERIISDHPAIAARITNREAIIAVKAHMSESREPPTLTLSTASLLLDLQLATTDSLSYQRAPKHDLLMTRHLSELTPHLCVGAASFNTVLSTIFLRLDPTAKVQLQQAQTRAELNWVFSTKSRLKKALHFVQSDHRDSLIRDLLLSPRDLERHLHDPMLLHRHLQSEYSRLLWEGDSVLQNPDWDADSLSVKSLSRLCSCLSPIETQVLCPVCQERFCPNCCSKGSCVSCWYTANPPTTEAEQDICTIVQRRCRNHRDGLHTAIYPTLSAAGRANAVHLTMQHLYDQVPLLNHIYYEDPTLALPLLDEFRGADEDTVSSLGSGSIPDSQSVALQTPNEHKKRDRPPNTDSPASSSTSLFCNLSTIAMYLTNNREAQQYLIELPIIPQHHPLCILLVGVGSYEPDLENWKHSMPKRLVKNLAIHILHSTYPQAAICTQARRPPRAVS